MLIKKYKYILIYSININKRPNIKLEKRKSSIFFLVVSCQAYCTCVFVFEWIKAPVHRSFGLWNDGRGLWWWFSITHHALGPYAPPPHLYRVFALNILSNLDHAGSILCYTHKHTLSTKCIILCLLEEQFLYDIFSVVI